MRAEYEHLTPAQAMALIVLPRVKVIDLRDPTAFEQGHLPHAINVGGNEIETIVAGTQRDRPVFFYCYHGNMSQDFSQLFTHFGFKHVSHLAGGFAAWAEYWSKALPNHPQLAVWLANHGMNPAQISMPGENGMTPLMRVAREGRSDWLHVLLAMGAETAAENVDGNQALWLACVSDDVDTLDVLIAAGLNLDHSNANGGTCLMYAASTGKDSIVARLLEAGANSSLQSQDGYTALDMAASEGCLRLLRRYA